MVVVERAGAIVFEQKIFVNKGCHLGIWSV